MIRIILVSSLVFFLMDMQILTYGITLAYTVNWITNIFSLIISFIIILIFSDLLPRTWGYLFPSKAIQVCGLFNSLFLVFFGLITYPIYLIAKKVISTKPTIEDEEEAEIKEKFIELIEENSKEDDLRPDEKQIIEAIIPFRNKNVREIMVPRMDMFCIEATTSIQEAAKQLSEQGYSRVPVYKEDIDHIIGVLMHKDILERYMYASHSKESEKMFVVSIESILKPILYTPESRKISLMLQEFRKNQSHIAIVVDEYGSTEGLVTMEDILEELVGEIIDEHDDDILDFKAKNASQTWIIDAKTSLHDIKQKFHISIPQDDLYDTIGGYIFHRLGQLPPQGFIIHHNDFQIEVLTTSERSIEMIKLTAKKKKKHYFSRN